AGQPALFLVVGAEPGDDRRADRGRDDHLQQAAARGGQFLADGREVTDAAAPAAELLGHVHAEVAELACLGPQLVGVLAGLGTLEVVLVPVLGAEVGDRLAQGDPLLALHETHDGSSSGVTTASTAPTSTWSPVATGSSDSTPVTGATILCSI